MLKVFLSPFTPSRESRRSSEQYGGGNRANLQTDLLALYIASRSSTTNNIEDKLKTLLINYQGTTLPETTKKPVDALFKLLWSDMGIKMVATAIKQTGPLSQLPQNWLKLSLLRQPLCESQFDASTLDLETLETLLEWLGSREEATQSRTAIIKHFNQEMVSKAISTCFASISPSGPSPMDEKDISSPTHLAEQSIIDFLYNKTDALPQYLFDYLPNDNLQSLSKRIGIWIDPSHTEEHAQNGILSQQHLKDLKLWLSQHHYLKETLEKQAQKAVENFENTCRQLVAAEICQEQYSQSLNALDESLIPFWAACAAARKDPYGKDAFAAQGDMKEMEKAFSRNALWKQPADNIYVRLQTLFDQADSASTTSTEDEPFAYSHFIETEIQRARSRSGLETGTDKPIPSAAPQETVLTFLPLEESADYFPTAASVVVDLTAQELPSPQIQAASSTPSIALRIIQQVLKTLYFPLKMGIALIQTVLRYLQSLYQKREAPAPASHQQETPTPEYSDTTPEISHVLPEHTSSLISIPSDQAIESSPSVLVNMAEVNTAKALQEKCQDYATQVCENILKNGALNAIQSFKNLFYAREALICYLNNNSEIFNNSEAPSKTHEFRASVERYIQNSIDNFNDSKSSHLNHEELYFIFKYFLTTLGNTLETNTPKRNLLNSLLNSIFIISNSPLLTKHQKTNERIEKNSAEYENNPILYKYKNAIKEYLTIDIIEKSRNTGATQYAFRILKDSFPEDTIKTTEIYWNKIFSYESIKENNIQNKDDTEIKNQFKFSTSPLSTDKNVQISTQFLTDSERNFINILSINGKEYRFQDENSWHKIHPDVSFRYAKHIIPELLKKFSEGRGDKEAIYLSNFLTQTNFAIDLSKILAFPNVEEWVSLYDHIGERYCNFSIERLPTGAAKLVITLLRNKIDKIFDGPVNLETHFKCDPSSSFVKLQISLEIDINNPTKKVTVLPQEEDSFYDFRLNPLQDSSTLEETQEPNMLSEQFNLVV